jgi:hypothetical protein
MKEMKEEDEKEEKEWKERKERENKEREEREKDEKREDLKSLLRSIQEQVIEGTSILNIDILDELMSQNMNMVNMKLYNESALFIKSMIAIKLMELRKNLEKRLEDDNVNTSAKIYELYVMLRTLKKHIDYDVPEKVFEDIRKKNHIIIENSSKKKEIYLPILGKLSISHIKKGLDYILTDPEKSHLLLVSEHFLNVLNWFNWLAGEKFARMDMEKISEFKPIELIGPRAKQVTLKQVLKNLDVSRVSEPMKPLPEDLKLSKMKEYKGTEAEQMVKFMLDKDIILENKDVYMNVVDYVNSFEYQIVNYNN